MLIKILKALKKMEGKKEDITEVCVKGKIFKTFGVYVKGEYL